MTLRKYIVALAVVSIMGVSVQKSEALEPPPVVILPAGSTVAAGAVATGAFVGIVAIICAYDFWLKLNGLKTWDGQPITHKAVRHRRRAAH
jgi:hypothetical protein